jgi:hypothetical protein
MALRPTQGDENGFRSATALHGSVALPFVIPTGANPDFLLRFVDRAACAAFREESRMKLAEPTIPNRKSGVAQWRDLRFQSFALPLLSGIYSANF